MLSEAEGKTALMSYSRYKEALHITQEVKSIDHSGAFFFDLFWPERHESRSVHLAWKICAMIMCILTLSDVLALTVIVATKNAYITGVDAVKG